MSYFQTIDNYFKVVKVSTFCYTNNNQFDQLLYNNRVTHVLYNNRQCRTVELYSIQCLSPIDIIDRVSRKSA